MHTDETANYRFLHPTERQLNLLPTEPSDWIVLAVIAIGGLGTAGWLNEIGWGWLSSLLLIPFGLLAWFAMYQPVSGLNERTYRMVGTVVKSLVLRVLRRGEVYRSEASVRTERTLKEEIVQEARHRGDTKAVDFMVDDLSPDTVANFERSERDMRRLNGVFPLEPRGIQIDDKTDIGLIFHRAKQTYTMVFTAPGSPVRGMSRHAQYNVMRGFADLIAKATAITGLSGLKVSMGVRNRPQDQWAIPEMLLEVCDPRVIMPNAILTEKPLEEYTDDDHRDVNLYRLGQQFSELTDISYKVDMVLTVTVAENDTMRKAFKSERLSEAAFQRLPIVSIRNIVEPLLQRLVNGNVRLLDTVGVKRYLRRAIDVSTLFHYYGEEEYSRVLSREQAQLDGSQQAIVTPQWHLPSSHIVATRKGVNIDGTYASVLDLTTFPQLGFDVHEMANLSDGMSTWSSFSVIGESINSGLEYAVTNRSAGMLAELKDRLGYITEGPKADMNAEARYQRLAEMASTGVNQSFVVRYATLGLSEDDVEYESGLDMDRFRGLGLGPVRVEQPSQQWLKFLTTVTLVDCE